MASPGGSMTSEESDQELDEDLQIVRDEHDQVLHLNYRGLTHLPDRLIQEASAFGSITRIYLKRNNIKTLVSAIIKSSVQNCRKIMVSAQLQ